LDDAANFYKVGLELFLNTRGEILDYLKTKEKKIFLDLKFHDIPNTVTQAAKWAAGLGVDMFNVHASGGGVMMSTTVETVKNTALNNGFKVPLIIGVTVLTSFDIESFSQVGYKYTIPETVMNLAQLCQKSGLDGVVCSPQEANQIKTVCGQEFMTVCPGVRPRGTLLEDQKRITTPQEAIKMGADYLVVGRPITKSINPNQAAKDIVTEMVTI